jgi:hypothetical protein
MAVVGSVGRTEAWEESHVSCLSDVGFRDARS